MKTLKFNTLALLISVSVLLPEAAVAYPEPVDQTEVAGNHGSGADCSPTNMSQPELRAQDDRSRVHPEWLENLIAPTSTTPFPQDRGTQVHICRLDLDLIETD